MNLDWHTIICTTGLIIMAIMTTYALNKVEKTYKN